MKQLSEFGTIAMQLVTAVAVLGLCLAGEAGKWMRSPVVNHRIGD